MMNKKYYIHGMKHPILMQGMVVAPGNVARAEKLFQGMGIQVVTGHRYLGGL